MAGVSGLLQASQYVSSWTILAFLAAFLLLVLGQRSELSKVPGPWHTKWTDLVTTYQWLSGRKPSYIHGLHLKYGPIVRVGPREVYIADTAAARAVFKTKDEFPKSRWYLTFIPFVENIFNTCDTVLHKRLRKLLSAPLSESGLQAFTAQIDDKVKLAIQRMKEEHETRGAADVYKWWLFLTTDVIGELSFGASFRMLENGKINQYAVDLQSAGRIASYRSAFPTLFKYCVRFGLSLPLLEQARGLGIRMRKYAQESLQRHRDVVAEHGVDAKPTLFTKVWVAEETDTITSDEIQNNAQAYIIAGSDTTSNELTYLVWAVCRRPDVKSRLLGELATLPDDFQYEQLRQLPYLNHVIDETLRRYPTAPAGLPREVPLGGAQVCGHYIPAGYTVATQAYTMHRNQAVFPEPEKFDPSRWENPTQAMKDSFMPFGAGSRICIGLHLAKMELRIGAARFFKAFPGAKISAVEGMSDEDMRPELFFLANPTGHRCLVELQ